MIGELMSKLDLVDTPDWLKKETIKVFDKEKHFLIITGFGEADIAPPKKWKSTSSATNFHGSEIGL